MKRALSILTVIVFAIVFAAQVVASGEITEPVPFEGKRVKQVSLGGDRSGVITDDGCLYVWGFNGWGELGNGKTSLEEVNPIKIMNNVASVSLGLHHSAAITTDGSLYMWGVSWDGRLGDGKSDFDDGSYVPIKIMDNVSSVSLNYNHSAAITTDGSLYMWGENDHGELGNGKSGSGEHETRPVKIMDNIAYVSLGSCYSAAITTDGSLYMWGANWDGQLGNGTTEDSSAPIKIMDNVAFVSLGNSHSAAITTDGSLYMWGKNYYGQLGNGKSGGDTFDYHEGIDSNVPIKIMDNVASVSLGGEHSAAIAADGNLFMWGENDLGQLGDGKSGGNAYQYTDGIDSNVPIRIMDNVASVSLGYAHSAAITSDGSLYMWGRNYDGQLGNGTTEGSPVPIRIIIPEDPPYTPADVNGDEDVTLDDAILTLQRAMKVDGGTPDFIEQAADLTGDGTITLEDAIEILKIAMKVTS